ncbi:MULTISPECIES: Ig-like domain-containing protein [unclassified Corallococcus]|uniref:Ig-like domain-containing protein n=1 Tax=unclassified Corallococcus TaxID=2685029 RepID=UPI001A909A61|nr:MULTISPECIES: Ig-like domain-containing protein [unclassified Corallococcus]MBN9684343.1 hypothetical protein [Corallococcus sp. NCSPR001]WAS84178.1 Ig-like domain-containing protein [Corallococcus sp. NCRR]
MTTARYNHTATLLPSGKVLVTGGNASREMPSFEAILDSAEWYDPATGTWSLTRPMATARVGHTATLLPSGKVLVSGGENLFNGTLKSAQLYDPDTGRWSSTGSMVSARYDHTATLLPSGKVLVSGGSGRVSEALSSAEVYDPVTEKWTVTGSMASHRALHKATRLLSGKVLVTGAAAAEIYDPDTGKWSQTEPINTARYEHAAVLLPSGNVLVSGGCCYITSAEVYNPETGKWSTTGSLAIDRYDHANELLPTGLVLAAGGDNIESAELYDPTAGTWHPVGSMITTRRRHTATLLRSGKVLIAGGFDFLTGSLSSAELYNASTSAVTNPSNGLSTSSNRPAYRGLVGLVSAVTVIVDGVPVGTTNANTLGEWTLNQPVALRDGYHTVMARVIDAVDNAPVDSISNFFLVDATPPAPPVLTTPVANSMTSGQPTYSGTAEARSTVIVIVNGILAGATMADITGRWSFVPPTRLPDGNHRVYARAMDTVGNTGIYSNTHFFTVDATPPIAPEITIPSNGLITNNNEPTYSGSAEAFSTVAVFVDGVQVDNTRADTAGKWTLTQPGALQDGSHVVKARATDAVGNTSAESNIRGFMVDTIPPTAPEIIAPSNGLMIHNNRPTYSGQAEPASSVIVFVDGFQIGATTPNVSGEWSILQPDALQDGSHQVQARAMDAAGNTGINPRTHAFTVDTRPPATPEITFPITGMTTNIRLPTYIGLAEEGSTVTVFVDGEPIGDMKADTSGRWRITQPETLQDGSHLVKARAMDAVGNASADSKTHAFTVDAAPPAAPGIITPANGSASNNSRPFYRGVAEVASLVTVFVDGVQLGSTAATTSGEWSLAQPEALQDGSHMVKAHAMDAVGNSSAESKTHVFVVDATPPIAPEITTPSAGLTIRDNQPTFSGLAEAGSTVAVLVDDVQIGTTNANSLGQWSIAQPEALRDGGHTVRGRTSDVSGNTSADSNTHAFVVDATPPGAPEIAAPLAGLTTYDNRPSYSGLAEAGSTVAVFVDDVQIGTMDATPLGQWSIAQPEALQDGSHTVKARATDAVGNTGPESNSNTFMVAYSAPLAPLVTTPPNNSAIAKNPPTYGGTADAGITVIVIVDGTSRGTTTADASGRWSFTPEMTLVAGSHTVLARAVNAAGKFSADSNTHTFTIRRSHYGWGCAAAPALPATWVLLALTWVLRGRRLKTP